MRIQHVQVTGIKSLLSAELENPGDFNLIVGRNNSGKSAFLHALSLVPDGYDGGFVVEEMARTQSLPPRKPSLKLRLDLTSNNLRLIFNEVNLRAPSAVLAKKVVEERWLPTWELSFESPGRRVEVVTADGTKLTIAEGGSRLNFDQVLDAGPDALCSELFRAKTILGHMKPGGPTNDPVNRLFHEIAISTFRIDSVRRSVRHGDLASPHQMKPNGENLVRALFELQLNSKPRYEAVVEFVREVLPDAGQPWVRVLGGHLEIHFEGRYGRSVPLHLMGSGAEQVLMIATLVSSVTSGFLLVEEPENYLHVGAQRRLVHKLSEFADRFQVFVSTHSHQFLDAATGARIFLTRLDNNGFTKATPVDLRAAAEVSAELGFRPSNLALSDIVLFVEGGNDIGGFEALLKLYRNQPGYESLGAVTIAIVPLGGNNMIKKTFDPGVFVKIHPCPFIVVDGEVAADRPRRLEFRDRCIAADAPCVMLDRVGFENFFTPAIVSSYYSGVAPAGIPAVDPDKKLKDQFPSFNKSDNSALATMLTTHDLIGTALERVFLQLADLAGKIAKGE